MLQTWQQPTMELPILDLSNTCPDSVQALKPTPLTIPAGTYGHSFERHRAAVRARLLQSDHARSGPESITWKINREIIMVAGWGRAILLQLAHPAVAAGVHGHSSFRGSLLSSFRRLRSTVGAMLSLTFGDMEEMITAAAGINTIHDRVRGRVPPSPSLRRTSPLGSCAGAAAVLRSRS